MFGKSVSRRNLLQASAGLFVAGLGRQHFAEEATAPTLDVHSRIRSDAENAPLAMRFTGTSAEECKVWQKKFGDKLRSILGNFAPPEKWTTTTEKRIENEDHVREELLLSAEGHPTLPVAVLTPKASDPSRRPGILMLHGHGPRGYYAIADGENSGLAMVRRGFVVAAPCFTPFGRRLDGPDTYRNADPCGISFIRMQLLGKLLIAENLRDALWTLELLACRDGVDPGRLACAGLSYGGRMTMLTAALEPRIRVAVVSGALNMLQERILGRYSCGAQVIPGLLQYGDVPEIGSLIAPRPAVWEWGNSDGLIDPARAEAGIAQMQRAYDALGAGDRLMLDRFNGGHDWSWRKALPLIEREFA